MTPAEVLARIDRVFDERGGGEYHGEAVTQLEHARLGIITPQMRRVAITGLRATTAKKSNRRWCCIFGASGDRSIGQAT